VRGEEEVVQAGRYCRAQPRNLRKKKNKKKKKKRKKLHHNNLFTYVYLQILYNYEAIGLYIINVHGEKKTVLKHAILMTSQIQ
jgi:hypothetical protein